MRILLLALLILVALWFGAAGATSQAAGNSLGPAAAIAVSGTHSCVLMADGDVRCWGTNGDGRLGDGTIASRKTPATVVGLEGEVVELIAGGFVRGRMCAVMEANDILCWGAGALGTDLTDRCTTKLGSWAGAEGSATNVRSDTIQEFPCSTSPEPLTIVDGKVMDLAMGNNHSCALLEDDRVKCWGSNSAGQLGAPPYEEEGDFTEVSGLEGGVASLTAGYEHSCALMETGTVKCWGSNHRGRLGDGTDVDSSHPVDVCWTFNRDSATCTEILDGVTEVAMGGNSTCAILEDGAVACWGGLSGPREESPAFCADERFECYLLPAIVEGINEVAVMVSVQSGRACAILESGRVNCWGGSAFGILGDGWICGVEIPTRCDVPVEVCVAFDFEEGACLAPLTDAVAVEAGQFHTCALKENGAVLCWGSNTGGRLGDGGVCRSPPPPELLAEAEHMHFCSVAVPVVAFVRGDVDRDGKVNSIDAALILQFEAALTDVLSSPGGADLNSDATIDSIDAQLALALEAGIKQALQK